MAAEETQDLRGMRLKTTRKIRREGEEKKLKSTHDCGGVKDVENARD